MVVSYEPFDGRALQVIRSNGSETGLRSAMSVYWMTTSASDYLPYGGNQTVCNMNRSGV